MDILFIEELIIFTIIGVNDWEQNIKQKLILDIEIQYNNQNAVISDDITDCLSYVDITEAILTYLQGKRFALVERVAEEIAELLMNRFNILNLRLRIGKPGAIPQAKMVGILLERNCSIK